MAQERDSMHCAPGSRARQRGRLGGRPHRRLLGLGARGVALRARGPRHRLQLRVGVLQLRVERLQLGQLRARRAPAVSAAQALRALLTRLAGTSCCGCCRPARSWRLHCLPRSLPYPVNTHPQNEERPSKGSLESLRAAL